MPVMKVVINYQEYADVEIEKAVLSVLYMAMK